MKNPISFLILLLLVGNIQASTPPDSIEVWLQRYCDQGYQYHALTTMVERQEAPVFPNQSSLYGVKDEYNTPAIRNAFELFIRSISLDDCTAACDSVIYSYPLSRRNIGHDDYPAVHIALSVYLWWGFTEDLYAIADTLYFFGFPSQDGYYSMLWNVMGTGYFEHIYNKTLMDTTFLNGPEIACAYLARGDALQDSMIYWAMETAKAAALSEGYNMRKAVAWRVLDAYMNGYADLKAPIDTLLNDTVESLRSHLIREIRRYQQTRHLLMEFGKQ